MVTAPFRPNRRVLHRQLRLLLLGGPRHRHLLYLGVGGRPLLVFLRRLCCSSHIEDGFAPLRRLIMESLSPFLIFGFEATRIYLVPFSDIDHFDHFFRPFAVYLVARIL